VDQPNLIYLAYEDRSVYPYSQVFSTILMLLFSQNILNCSLPQLMILYANLLDLCAIRLLLMILYANLLDLYANLYWIFKLNF
jgi:hypothetical protein